MLLRPMTTARALDRNRRGLEQAHHARRRARPRARFVEHERADILAMESVDVLLGVDRVRDGDRVEMRRQRHLDQEAVNLGRGVQARDRRHQLALRHRCGQRHHLGDQTQSLRGAHLVADVDLARRIFADDDDGEAGRDALGLERADAHGELVADPMCNGGPVDDRRAHVSARSTRRR
jgi:hypothetical protein